VKAPRKAALLPYCLRAGRHVNGVQRGVQQANQE
jgi:hypothetical protein